MSCLPAVVPFCPARAPRAAAGTLVPAATGPGTSKKATTIKST
jgi:hypothetical protein